MPIWKWAIATYTTPWLSVRIVQPLRLPCWKFAAAGVICLVIQVLPPSRETATLTGSGKELPCELLSNAALHSYTRPKNGLLAALSAQICSLSLKVVELCLDTTTGAIQAFLSPAAAAATLSVRETATASAPLKAFSLRIADRLAVRFA